MATKKTNVKRRKMDWGKVTDKIKDSEKKVSYNQDDGYSDKLFVPKLDENGTYQAIVRFLPRPVDDGDGVPFVKMMNHGFSDVGGWFIENCPTTKGEKCPVCIANGVEWKAGNEDLSRRRARKTSYFSNLLVVKDPQNEDNNGKVFIFRYGKKIHDKIMEKIAPPEGSIDEPVQVFDYESGQNFKLKISKTKSTINGQLKEFNNYDSSAFTGVSTSIAETAKDEEAIETQLHELGTIIADERFKSFAELEKKFLEKTGTPVGVTKPAPEPVAEKVAVTADSEGEEISDDDFFKKIREE